MPRIRPAIVATARGVVAPGAQVSKVNPACATCGSRGRGLWKPGHYPAHPRRRHVLANRHSIVQALDGTPGSHRRHDRAHTSRKTP